MALKPDSQELLEGGRFLDYSRKTIGGGGDVLQKPSQVATYLPSSSPCQNYTQKMEKSS